MHSIGIDIVEIHRFNDWHKKSNQSLRRIFSTEEIDYCLKEKSKSAERFSVRFAAREAFFKAFQQIYYDAYQEKPPYSFLFICRHLIIKKNIYQMPFCSINWHALSPASNTINFLKSLNIQLSLSHTKNLATAIVAIKTKYEFIAPQTKN